MTTRTGQPRPSTKTTLWVAGIALAFALVVLAAMIWQSESLARHGLVGQVWFIVVLLVGLASSISLFALFQSYANWSGKALGGTLKLGGPGVLMCVIVFIAFRTVPEPVTHFDQTVFVHGEGGHNDLVLRGRGTLMLDLGQDRRPVPIGPNGEVHFINIPADQRGRKVAVVLDATDYEPVDPAARIELGTDTADLAVRARTLHLMGQVLDPDGRPLAGADVSLPHARTTTDADGRFDLRLAADLPEQDRTTSITASGFAPWRGTAVPGGGALVVQMRAGR